MILDASPHNRSEPDFLFFPGRRCGAHLLKFPSRFTAYSSYLIELQVDRMILVISPHDRTKPYLLTSFDSRACPLKFSNRLTVHSSHPIRLKLDKILLDIILRNRYEQDFPFFLGAFFLWDVLRGIFK